VQTVISLNLVKEVGQRGGRVCSNSGDQIVIRAAKAIKHIPYELIIIQRFSRNSKFGGKGFHLGEVLLSRKISFLGVIEGTTKLLHSRLGRSRYM
jgi:hypothetical protein